MTTTAAAALRESGAQASAPSDIHEEKRRSAIRGAFFSEYIDMFDIYLPVVALAPVMFLFQPKGL